LRGGIALVFELCARTLKEELLSESMGGSDDPAPVREAVAFATQLCKAMRWIHFHDIIHRDLKPQNILIQELLDGRQRDLKVADFGGATNARATATEDVCTLWYRAPESLLHAAYSPSADMWSVGCVFAEFELKHAIFRGNHTIGMLFTIFQALGTPNLSDCGHQWMVDAKDFRQEVFPKFSPGGLPLAAKCGEALASATSSLLQLAPSHRSTAREVEEFLSREACPWVTPPGDAGPSAGQ